MSVEHTSRLLGVFLRLFAAAVRRMPSNRRLKPFCVRRSAQLARHHFDFTFNTLNPGVRWTMEAFPDLLTRHLLFEGTYQEDVILAIQNLANKGDVVFDVGGHHGLMAVVTSRVVGSEGKVISFEPNPLARMELEKNLKLNKASNVHVVPLALGDAAGEVPFFAQQGTASWNSSLFNHFIGEGYTVKELKVSADTMDAYVKRSGYAPQVIKIDVEGSEFLVLKGAQETMRLHRPALIMEFNPDAARAARTTIGAMVQWLQDLNSRLFVLRRNRWGRYRFRRQEPFEESKHCRDDLANVICIPTQASDWINATV